MSTSPLNPASYQAVPSKPQPETQTQISPVQTHNLSKTAKYGLAILVTVMVALLAILAISSITMSTSTILPIPRVKARTLLLPEKTPTTVVWGTLYSVDWTDVDGSASELYEASAICGPAKRVTKCVCNPIAMDARDVCATVVYAAPYANFLTRNEGCLCMFQGEAQCQNGAFTMYVDCTPK